MWSIAAHGQDPLGTDQLPFVAQGFKANGSICNAFLFNGDTRSLIENALGGFRNDILIGNQTTNQLFGNSGNDTLFGHEGDQAARPSSSGANDGRSHQFFFWWR